MAGEDHSVRYNGLTVEQIRDIVVRWAAWCGDPHPTASSFVATNLRDATDLLFGRQPSAPGSSPHRDHVDGVVAMAIGRFENGSIGTPVGAAPPSGTAALVVIARSGQVLHRGLQVEVPDLTALGTVVAL